MFRPLNPDKEGYAARAFLAATTPKKPTPITSAGGRKGGFKAAPSMGGRR